MFIEIIFGLEFFINLKKITQNAKDIKREGIQEKNNVPSNNIDEIDKNSEK